MRALLSVPLLVSIAAFAACGGSDDDGNDPSPTAAVTATPSASPPTSHDLPPLLEPGTYTSEVFEPGVSVVIPDDRWRLVADVESEYVFERGIPDEGGKGFVGFFKVSEVRSEDNFSTPEPVPEDLIAWLMNHRDIILISGPTPVEVDGIAGQQIDIETDTEYGVQLFDNFELHFRDAARFISLEVNGEPVVIYAGPETTPEFEEFMTFAEPVIASLDFE